MPKVLDLHGREGVVPEGAAYIGDRLFRGSWCLPASKWRNPFKFKRHVPDTPENRAYVVTRYEQYLYKSGLIKDIHELRGKDLACWCAPKPCHGDVLLRLANAHTGEDTP